MQKTYSESFLVRGGDCDKFRRMRLDALFFAMQEGGEHHAKTLGVGYESMQSRGLFFVLSRIHVKIARMPRCGETVVHTTWPGEANKFFCPRYHTFTLEDGTLLASAGALWVMLDTAQRRIVSPKKTDLGFPDNSDLTAPVDLPMRVPRPGENPIAAVRTPVFSEFDLNGHVNNTKYIAWLCDTLGSERLSNAYIHDLTVSYEKEIRVEEPFLLELCKQDDCFTFQVLSSAGEKHFFAAGELCKEV